MSTTRGLTRRGLLGGSLAAGAAALAGPAAARGPGAGRYADVVVVGAGLAGLTAARRVHRAGRSVIVLEARGRVGGRCFSRPIGAGADDVANMGATFVGPTQTRVQALMSELGIHRFPTYAKGDLVWYEDGKAKPYRGLIPPSSDPQAVIQIGTVVLPDIDGMARGVPLDAPWKAQHAEEWDSITLETWAEQNISSAKARAIFALSVEAVLSVEPRDVSLLYFLFYVHAAGSINALVANAGAGGAQDYRVSGGTQRIAITLARHLGDRVQLGRPVQGIEHAGRDVVVRAGGEAVRCRRVIVAIPPNLGARIVYEPALPARRNQLMQRMPVGSLIKTIAVYERPFWRAEGLNGQVTSVKGPVQATFDASPQSGRPGVLMGFIDGDDARALSDRSFAVRRRAALASYERYFGARAARPRAYLDHVWDREVYTGGCPVGVMPPGVMTEYGPALRGPVGRIHWAGTETATRWNGYMDGAVRSGERAASEVLAAL